ncbi:MAG: MerR family transcriptional regulator [bacterium]
MNTERQERTVYGSSIMHDGEMGKYTMSVAVRLTDVEAHRIRRFEAFGLLRPDRTDSKQRLYSDAEIELIREIAELETEGVNLPGVRMILAMRRGERS